MRTDDAKRVGHRLRSRETTANRSLKSTTFANSATAAQTEFPTPSPCAPIATADATTERIGGSLRRGFTASCRDWGGSEAGLRTPLDPLVGGFSRSARLANVHLAEIEPPLRESRKRIDDELHRSRQSRTFRQSLKTKRETTPTQSRIPVKPPSGTPWESQPPTIVMETSATSMTGAGLYVPQ